MAIDLRTFASGDTDYISKLNANMEALKAAIDGLQRQAGAVAPGSAASSGQMVDALFNNNDALIGPGSYLLLTHASTVTVDPGAMYLAEQQIVVSSYVRVTINFLGQPAGTHYIVVDTAGVPGRSDSAGSGAIYSVYWTGSSFQTGYTTKMAPVFYDTLESEASRQSTTFNKAYKTLDERLEVGESLSKEAAKDAEQALAVAYELQAVVGGERYRKIGVTVDGTTGLKGAIQIDFDGTIMGWSCIADRVGSLKVEVNVKASSPPPNAPAIPDETVDIITAAAPITMTSSQSASKAEQGVTTWDRELNKWDVVQFNVIEVFTITRATLYLRILEDVPSPPVINPLEDESPWWDQETEDL